MKMWPQALQLSKEECRGISRRLELEAYSQVISVFRAQGGLNETKVKLLEDLRAIFHISQERHRAEARRVANDEQLSTIAEIMSGPNTWQEWSREGRRSFPMLPRVAPQTALSLISNKICRATAIENSKLPYPYETAEIAIEEHNACISLQEASLKNKESVPYIVTSDPFKVPDIPIAPKKSLKRVMSDNLYGYSKKRLVNDIASNKSFVQSKQYLNSVIKPNALLNASPSKVRKICNNHSKLQQQRFFHQQQIQKQKPANKKSMAVPKRQKISNKTGKRAQKNKDQNIVSSKKELQFKQNEQEQNQPTTQTMHPQNSQNISPLHGSMYSIESQIVDNQSEIIDTERPQIAASKKDITKNITKLQIPGHATSPSFVTARVANISDLQTSSTVSPTMALNKFEKPLISSPVQKYIVEDRQPHVQNVTSTPQIMTLPQLSAAATKLRAVNTTILPPGTKITKKIATTSLASTASSSGAISTGLVEHGSSTLNALSSNQVMTINEMNKGSLISGTSTASPPVPTHTPPAIIQLHSSGSGSSNSGLTSNIENSQPSHSSQSKVLTTKILPIVLSGTGVNSTSNSSNITKIETINNGATIVGSSGGNTTGGTIIKNLPSTVILPSQGTPNTSALVSTLTSRASMFRKSTNLIKTGVIGMTTGSVIGGNSPNKIGNTFKSNTSNTGPQIISNIKLASAISSNALTTPTSTNSQQYLQNQLKNAKTTIRASVKICQSPNGKVFIQSANLDPSKSKLGSNVSSPKILQNSLITAATGVVSTTSSPQRIAIQKVQIIPAPTSSTVSNLPATIQQLQQQKSATLTISGKNNMIFMPATGARSSSGTITLNKNNVLNASSNINTILGMKSHQQVEVTKPNVVVIGASTIQQQTATPGTSLQKSTKFVEQMITEDTPVDIVDTSGSVSVGNISSSILGNNIGDTITLLSSHGSLIENPSKSQHNQQHQQQLTDAQFQNESSTIIPTDWEMELDQATASTQSSKESSNELSGQNSNENNGRIVIEDNFEDVIVVEHEEDNEDLIEQTSNSQINNDDNIIMMDVENTNIINVDSDSQEIHDDSETIGNDFNRKNKLDTSNRELYTENDAGFDETIVTEVDDDFFDKNSTISNEELSDRDHNDDDHDLVIKINDGASDRIPCSSKTIIDRKSRNSGILRFTSNNFSEE